MPKLPGAEQLGVRQFQDRSSVVTPTADFSGQNALVSAVNNISKGMNERLDRSSLHKAKIHFQKAKLEADAAFDRDPDFKTYQERYDKKIASAMESSGSMVRNPRDRELFQEQMSLYRAEGNKQIIAKAWIREADYNILSMNDTLSIARENHLRASNAVDKQFAIDTANDVITANIESGYISATEGEGKRKALALDLAIATVEATDPDKRLKLLKKKQGIIKELPTDTYNKMVRSAEAQLSAQVALDTANTIREAGGTLDERMVEVNKIKDPKVKSAAKAQVKDDYNLEETAEGKARYKTYDAMAKNIIAGESLTNIKARNPKEWESLGSKEQLALIGMSQTRKSNETDFNVYHKLNILKKTDRQEAYLYFLENVSSFSNSDAKTESDYFTSGLEEPKPLFSMKETFNRKVKELKLKGEDLGKAEMRIREEYDSWTRANPDKTMNTKEQDFVINSVFDEVVGTGFLGWGKDNMFALPKVEADKVKLQNEFDRYARERNNGNPPDAATMEIIRNVMVKRGMIGDYQVPDSE
jgi:hypothetical protein